MRLYKLLSIMLTVALLWLSVACKGSNTPSANVTPLPSELATTSTLPPKTPDVTPGSDVTEPGIKRVEDFGFLADKNGVFNDIKGNPSWYPGKVQRNLDTGEVTYVWDRSAETLAMLNEYGAIYRGDEENKVCYFTFDCGYENCTEKYPNGITPIVLDILKEKNIKATFFLVGDYINSCPDIVKRMVDDGHIVANHTLKHRSPTEITPEEFVDDVMKNQELMDKLLPYAPKMVYYRPPAGAANERTLALAQAMGLTTVFWSATAFDFDLSNQPSDETMLSTLKEKLHNGCVYLMHPVSPAYARILDDLIDYIQGQGYEIRSISTIGNK